jgi:hypothetical protein
MSIYEILMVVLTVARLVFDIIKHRKDSRFARCRGIRHMDEQARPHGSLLAQIEKTVLTLASKGTVFPKNHIRRIG